MCSSLLYVRPMHIAPFRCSMLERIKIGSYIVSSTVSRTSTSKQKATRWYSRNYQRISFSYIEVRIKMILSIDNLSIALDTLSNSMLKQSFPTTSPDTTAFHLESCRIANPSRGCFWYIILYFVLYLVVYFRTRSCGPFWLYFHNRTELV